MPKQRGRSKSLGFSLKDEVYDIPMTLSDLGVTDQKIPSRRGSLAGGLSMAPVLEIAPDSNNKEKKLGVPDTGNAGEAGSIMVRGGKAFLRSPSFSVADSS